MGFPQLGNIEQNIFNTIMNKAGNNKIVSEVMPWIRVTSCLGNRLALQSSKESESFAQRYGNTSRSGRLGTDKNGKPVFATDDTRGLRPSPLINSLSVTQGNEGLSKKTSFTITCHSLGQCEDLLKYFLEPGNMVLVEWGQNSWKSVGGGRMADISSTCAIAKYNNIKHVTKLRKDSKGLYDALLGVITGGAMGYGDNETFEISVELTSVGELPAYLQHHRGIGSDTDIGDSSLKFDETNIEQTVNVGVRLFKQMFNDLPAHKRTQTIYNFVKDKRHTLSTNFVNMDKEMREELLEASKKGNTIEASKGEKVEIISDMPLFTDKRFIRVALAFEILDTVEGTETKVDASKGTCEEKTSGNVIWQNTICRAHKNMFSADSDYLYIPNEKAPAFDLLGALITEKDASGNVKPYKNALPPLTKTIRENKELITSADAEKNQTADLHPKPYNEDEKSAYFPATQKLSFKDQANFDGTYLPLEADPGQWGFLRDLYINFDFFCDVIDKKGLVTKDVYYELLNGMTSACNLYWDFQIIPRGRIKAYAPPGFCSADLYYKHYQSKDYANGDGSEELQVVDAGFQGKAADGSVGLARFQSRGTKTPFLEAELNFDIPGAMKGMTLAQKLSKESELNGTNPEMQETSFKGLFVDNSKAAELDEVVIALNSLKPKTPPEEQGEEVSEEDKLKIKEDANEEQIKSNYEYFVGNSMIIPKEQDREVKRDLTRNWFFERLDNNVNLDDFVVVGAWNDSELLKKIQLLNEGFLSGNSTLTGTNKINVPLLPIKFNFTIHGVSGIKVGDTFNIEDLPTRYKTKVFQVVQISHDIAQNIWTTKVEGQLRNLERSEKPYKIN